MIQPQFKHEVLGRNQAVRAILAKSEAQHKRNISFLEWVLTFLEKKEGKQHDSHADVWALLYCCYLDGDDGSTCYHCHRTYALSGSCWIILERRITLVGLCKENGRSIITVEGRESITIEIPFPEIKQVNEIHINVNEDGSHAIRFNTTKLTDVCTVRTFRRL